MLPIPTIIIVSIVGLILLSIVVWVASSNFMSIIVVLILAGVLFYVLNQLGIIKVSDTNGLDVSFFEKAPLPASTKSTGKSLEKKEVFYISGNDYTYEDAPAVCAAYDAELATYDEINQAYSAGAEWCGYGWTQGGMALYPTQDSTWQKLQSESNLVNRTACGRPGVNGGYFDPDTKFGVNCYGVKPKDHGIKFPLPVPGTDTQGFQKMVNKFKSMIKKITVSPFNRDGWSEWNVSSHINPQAQGIVNTIENDFEGGWENVDKKHK